MTLTVLNKTFREKADVQKAVVLERFFKTAPGEYGHGDKFLGIAVPEIRKFAKQHSQVSFDVIEKLIRSAYNEERALGLFILIQQFEKSKEDGDRKVIFDFYVNNRRFVNNWNLVDLSVRDIVGNYLLDRDRKLLYTWAVSSNLWEKRMSVVATYAFIIEKEFKDTFKIAKMLLKDTHDLIHKAVGWMLREVGKRDLEALELFLEKHIQGMPRTMLRYAIERFPETKRQKYLKM